MSYTLRDATDADKTWLEELRRAAYRELFDMTCGGWDEQRHQRHFTASWNRGRISIVEKGHDAIGMVQVVSSVDAVEIKEIQIHPQFQGQGYGRRIIRDIVNRARGEDVILSLGLKNEGAYRLYKRLGFQETARTETHIYMKRVS